MHPLVIAALAGIGFIVAYHTYGRWLGRCIFELAAGRKCPSEELEDGSDYVPTSRWVVFGHHFTSIAGTGPIVGPAIAIMWGWLPALLWVVLGSVFIGAVHDLGSLVVSMRHKGKTVGDLAGQLVNSRVRLLFLLVLFVALTIVLAVFGLVIAAVFTEFPSAIFPCLVQIPIAVVIGLWLHRRGVGLVLPSLVALALMYLTVIFGDWGPLHAFNSTMAGLELWQWTTILLVYCFIASVLPVWMLLQPRDFINALQLLSALALIVLGLTAAALFGGAVPSGVEMGAGAEVVRPKLEMVAPIWNLDPSGAPAMYPFLFITIACGAISGFHCLVSSGTSSKQIRNEKDAQFIGYGSMLTEGFLATLVILACGAGLGLGMATENGLLFGAEAFQHRYSDWGAAGSLKATVGAFVTGGGNFLAALGISAAVGKALMGVLVASFAATTMDTACRLQRYVVQELAGGASGPSRSPRASLGFNPLGILRNPYMATLVAVGLAALLAAIPPVGKDWSFANAGKGGLLLWPIFGATNQLLGGLAFIVITFYLWRHRKPIWFIALPAAFMLAMPMWGMLLLVFAPTGWLASENYLLASIGIVSILLEIWMIVEAIVLFPKARDLVTAEA